MDSNNLEAKYGLPSEVKYCRYCVMSNQKPNASIEFQNVDGKRKYIDFDEDEACAACRYEDNVKKKIDWKQREEQLKQLLSKYRKKDGSYDVIVPASGGKDSIYAAYHLKYTYKMNPLTVTWAPHIYRQTGWRNLQRMIHVGGLDNILFTPNGKVHRLLTRLAFKNILHPFQPFILGQKNIGPNMSLLYNVPLVFYGESNVEYGDPEDPKDPTMDKKYYSVKKKLDETYLGGVSLRELIEKYNLTLKDVKAYIPVDQTKLTENNTQMHYLGYYMKWDPQECYYFAADKTGFEPDWQRSEGTYCKYTELDDKLISLHFYTMFAKFGIGRAMYDASQEIRNKKITREEGLALVRKFDGEYPNRYLRDILEYLGMSKVTFDKTVDSFRSPHLWKIEDGEWKLRHLVK